MMKNKIAPIGMMLARNLISQGYPFIEAILSVIHYCKKIVICEGYSTDNTYNVLKKLEEIYNGKIEIIRKKWIAKSKFGEFFSKILNDILTEYEGEYILKIDPDHVFSKETLDTLLFLARNYQKIQIFCIPYLYFIGNWIIKPELWAATFFRNNGYIRFRGDSADVEYTLKGIIKSVTDPRKPLSVLKHVYYSYVPKPVYHYYGLFPGNYLTRIKEHKKYYRDYDWSQYDKTVEKLKAINDWDIFWDTVVEDIIKKNWSWYGNFEVVKYSGEHHQLIKPLIGEWKYQIRNLQPQNH